MFQTKHDIQNEYSDFYWTERQYPLKCIVDIFDVLALMQIEKGKG